MYNEHRVSLTYNFIPQAHVAPVASLDGVKAVMEVLLENNKIRAATHNMMAYRIRCPDRDAFMQVCHEEENHEPPTCFDRCTT